jgi:flagellar biosynthesis chaperone FliJ
VNTSEKIEALSKKLKEASEEIKRLETKKAVLENNRDNYIKQLETEFGVSTVEAAEKLIAEYEEVIKQLENQVAEIEASLDQVMESAKS